MNKIFNYLPAPMNWEDFRKILISSEEVLSWCLLRDAGAVIMTAPSGKKVLSQQGRVLIKLQDGSILEYGVINGEVLSF